MTSNANTVARSSRIFFALIATIAVIVASLVLMIMQVEDVAAAMIQQDARPDLTIEKSPFSGGELMAGDHLRQTVVARADIDAIYGLNTSVAGDEDLVEQMMVRITAIDTAEVLYDGPLSEAGFGGRLLSGGEPEELTIDVHLPSSAATGMGGLTVSVDWSYSATRVI